MRGGELTNIGVNQTKGRVDLGHVVRGEGEEEGKGGEQGANCRLL